ncbi:class I SAM-dependent methyltransferase [Spirosoma panaciterrae]|uniref:class I SAM-dependent methyltransferase n=1 Tax=Spirosoma panaciterrae TaxID=496058 RepID=UPI00037498E1|nr:class I SAM-dependent methyltransferase [Spirosoma panaciterrae]
MREKQFERQLRHVRDFSYTSDWTSYNYSNWETWFAPYRSQPNLRILEIGSFEGRSAVWFLQHILTHPSAQLVCVDPMPWPVNPPRPRFMHNIQLTGQASQVTLVQERSEIALTQLPPASFDIIYIDGAHDAINVLADGIYSWELLKVGGLMLFDDYLWEPDQPEHSRCQRAIDLLLKQFGARKTLIHQGYQALIRKDAD